MSLSTFAPRLGLKLNAMGGRRSHICWPVSLQLCVVVGDCVGGHIWHGRNDGASDRKRLCRLHSEQLDVPLLESLEAWWMLRCKPLRCRWYEDSNVLRGPQSILPCMPRSVVVVAAARSVYSGRRACSQNLDRTVRCTEPGLREWRRHQQSAHVSIKDRNTLPQNSAQFPCG